MTREEAIMELNRFSGTTQLKLSANFWTALEMAIKALEQKSTTVTDFADRCRECGKTAITRAENDEILNEAWSLLINVSEEDSKNKVKILALAINTLERLR